MPCIAKTINAKKFGDSIDVEWDDCWANSEWRCYDSAMKVPDEVFCKTRAFFVGQTEHFVHIAHTIGLTKENEIAGLLLIHKGIIRSVR